MSDREARRSKRRTRKDKGGSKETKEPEDVWSQLVVEAEKPTRPPNSSGAGGAGGAGDGGDASAAGGGAAGDQEGGGATAASVLSNSEKGRESFVLFCGPKQSGKSTVITHFLNPSKADDSHKPTVALEYTFGRRSNTASTVKDIAHLWELGGGTHLSELLSVPLTPQRLPHAVVVIVVDMSKPGNVLDELMTWLGLVVARVNECTDKIKRGSASKLAELEAAARERVGLTDDHPDARIVTPCVVPLVIVAAKYDEFYDQESVRRKPLMQALRYIAHVHGASLICVHRREKTLLAHFRAMLNHFVFGTEKKKSVSLDVTKPMVVQAGADSLESIGAPNGATLSDVTEGPLSARMAPWKRAVAAYFPPAASEAEEDKRADDEAARWMEPTVDSMRAQKEEELQRYVKEAERKLRLEASKKPGRV